MPGAAPSWGGAGLPPPLLYLWHHTLRWLYHCHQGTQSFFKAMFWGSFQSHCKLFLAHETTVWARDVSSTAAPWFCLMQASAVLAVCLEGRQGRLVHGSVSISLHGDT